MRRTRRRVECFAGLALALGLAVWPAARARGHAPEAGAAETGREEAEAGGKALGDIRGTRAHHGNEYSRRFASYRPPQVTLLGRDGKEVELRPLLEAGTPTVLNFIFTSCTTICPVQTATLAALQERLAGARPAVRVVSISIDPQRDTPARLAEYSERHRAAGSWLFLTGDPDSVRRVEKAFDAFRGDKRSHTPLTFLKASRDGPWLRLEGFPSPDDLVREYQKLVEPRPEALH